MSETVINLEDLMGSKSNNDFLITDDIIFLTGEINPTMSKEIVAYIISCNFSDNPPKSLSIIIDSHGGCMESTFAIISAMRASSMPIYTVALGKCASGALMIAITGKKRYVDKYCSVMSHTLSTGYPDFAKLADLKLWMDDVKNSTDKMVDLYIEHTNLSEEKIRRKLLPENGDMYLTAEQAINYKLFDGYFTSYDQIK